jgi:hypothetical protein
VGFIALSKVIVGFSPNFPVTFTDFAAAPSAWGVQLAAGLAEPEPAALSALLVEHPARSRAALAAVTTAMRA